MAARRLALPLLLPDVYCVDTRCGEAEEGVPVSLRMGPMLDFSCGASPLAARLASACGLSAEGGVLHSPASLNASRLPCGMPDDEGRKELKSYSLTLPSEEAGGQTSEKRVPRVSSVYVGGFIAETRMAAALWVCCDAMQW